MSKEKPVSLQDLIDILALPNMGDEGRKAKLIAIKEWQIKFLEQTQATITNLEKANEKDYNSPKCQKCAQTFSCANRASNLGKISVLKDVLSYEP